MNFFLCLAQLLSSLIGLSAAACSDCYTTGTNSCGVDEVCVCKTGFSGSRCEQQYQCRASSTGTLRDCASSISWATCAVDCASTSQKRFVVCVDRANSNTVTPSGCAGLTAPDSSRSCSTTFSPTVSFMQVSPLYTNNPLQLSICIYDPSGGMNQLSVTLNNAAINLGPITVNTTGATNIVSTGLIPAALYSQSVTITAAISDGNSLSDLMTAQTGCNKPGFTCSDSRRTCVESTAQCTQCVPGRSGSDCGTSRCSSCVADNTDSCNTNDGEANSHVCACKPGFAGELCQYGVQCRISDGSFVSCDTEAAWATCTVNCATASQTRTPMCTSNNAAVDNSNCGATFTNMATTRECTGPAVQVSQFVTVGYDAAVPSIPFVTPFNLSACIYIPSGSQWVSVTFTSASGTNFELSEETQFSSGKYDFPMNLPVNTYVKPQDVTTTAYLSLNVGAIETKKNVNIVPVCDAHPCADKKFQCTYATGACNTCVSGRSGTNCEVSACSQCNAAGTASCNTDDTQPNAHECICKQNNFGKYCNQAWYIKSTGGEGFYDVANADSLWNVSCEGSDCLNQVETRTLECYDRATNALASAPLYCDLSPNIPVVSRACTKPTIKNLVVPSTVYFANAFSVSACVYLPQGSTDEIKFQLAPVAQPNTVYSITSVSASALNSGTSVTIPVNGLSFIKAQGTSNMQATVTVNGNTASANAENISYLPICQLSGFKCENNKYVCNDETSTCDICVSGRSGPNCEVSACSQCNADGTASCNTDDSQPDAHVCKCKTYSIGSKCEQGWYVKSTGGNGFADAANADSLWNTECTGGPSCETRVEARTVECYDRTTNAPTASPVCDAVASSPAVSRACSKPSIDSIVVSTPSPIYFSSPFTVTANACRPQGSTDLVTIQAVLRDKTSETFSLGQTAQPADLATGVQVTVPSSLYVTSQSNALALMMTLDVNNRRALSLSSALTLTSMCEIPNFKCSDNKFACNASSGQCDTCVTGRSGANCEVSDCTKCYGDGTASCNTDDALSNPHKCQCKPGFFGDKCQITSMCRATDQAALDTCDKANTWNTCQSAGTCDNYVQTRKTVCYDHSTQQADTTNSCSDTPILSRPCPTAIISSTILSEKIFSNANFDMKLCLYNPSTPADILVSVTVSGNQIPLKTITGQSTGEFTTSVLMQSSAYVENPTVNPSLTVSVASFTTSQEISIQTLCSSPCSDTKFVCNKPTGVCDTCKPGRSGTGCVDSFCSQCNPHGITAVCNTDDSLPNAHVCSCKAGFTDGLTCEPVCNNSDCLHQGAYVIVDRQCTTTCQCQGLWGGNVCQTCTHTCNANDIRFKHNAECSGCVCNDNWFGSSCTSYGINVRVTISSSGGLSAAQFQANLQSALSSILETGVTVQTPTQFGQGFSALVQVFMTQDTAVTEMPSRNTLYTIWSTYIAANDFSALRQGIFGNSANTVKITPSASIHDSSCTSNSSSCKYDPSVLATPVYYQSQPTTTTTGKKSDDNTGAIVGGVIGGVAAVALVGGLFYYFVVRSNSKVAISPVPPAQEMTTVTTTSTPV